MSWQQALDIRREAREQARLERSQPRLACPNDGEPLTTGPDGRVYCPFDGWRPNN